MTAAGDTPWQCKKKILTFSLFFFSYKIQEAYLQAVDFKIQRPITELAHVQ
jgi:hypothetical protein